MTVVVTGAQATAAALLRSLAQADRLATTAVAVTAGKVKRGAAQRISGHRYLPAYPSSITYTVSRGAAGPEAEIGPDKGRPQGPLGNLIEYGSVNNAPLPHLGPALDENADDLVRGITIAIAQALR
ncbi:hypothetical protein AB0M23_28385 [Streptomyces sp. NPDC052077]|uniref:hypothetical protein n=1 Tax=Streptomyces sp. NPDC052077 TaxID=3154757 RepID=UPI0034364D70